MLRLFGRPTSSNTQKVLWTLCEIPSRPSFELVLASARLGADSNLLCDSTGAKPYGVVDTEEYRRLNPTRLVPCLVDGSLAVWESHSIVRYLAQKYAPELHLGTVEGMARSQAEPALSNAKICLRGFFKAGYVEKLQKVEEQIGETDAYVTGRDFSIADIVIGAELCRFSCGMTRWAREPRGFPTLVQLPNLERYFR
ncbi:unnamed protein product, partial [Effrenium voratum]